MGKVKYKDHLKLRYLVPSGLRPLKTWAAQSHCPNPNVLYDGVTWTIYNDYL